MRGTAERTDYAVLDDRMGYLLLLRVAFVAVVLSLAALRPELLGAPTSAFDAASLGYLAFSALLEVLRQRSLRAQYALLTTLLLVDGVYLAWAMYATGATQSPLRFLIYLHLVAVSLLASCRTGLKIALWHSLLLFVVLYAQAARLIPAVDVIPGHGIEFDRMPVLNVTSFWLFALATSVFSSMNERELRRRKMDLQAMVEVGARLDEVRDPVRQAQLVLDGLARQYGFRRGLVLGETDGETNVLASFPAASLPEGPSREDKVVRLACERREQLLVKRVTAAQDPFLAAALPDARNVLVSPMIADGHAVGVIVLERGRTRRGAGLERRVASVVSQFAGIAALNLRNAVLLERVQDLAERDSLTGAANRRTFQATLTTLLGTYAVTRPKRVLAVLFIDLDDFKVVNDSFGHAVGDGLLVAVTERIGGLVRASDLVARLGGDEFAVLTEDDSELTRARSIAERLVAELRAPYLVGGRTLTVSASIGIASTLDSADTSELVRNADVAMYMAKADGKARCSVFDPAMHAAMQDRHRVSGEIQRAVDLRQLRIVYQPIVDLRSGAYAGVEALVRWEHPERGMLTPDRFIEIAEENGAIVPIGRWVLQKVSRDLARWQRARMTPDGFFACVNVSAREVQQVGLVPAVKAALAASGLDPTALVLEITETALLKATPVTMSNLAALRALGIRTSIDDFGTGFCSLSHLRQIPVDALKIASEFVGDFAPGSRSPAVAGAIVALSRSLNIATVAEGIETPEQAVRMSELGCTYGQGYYFARPMPGRELRAALRSVSAGPGHSDEIDTDGRDARVAVAALGRTA